MIRVRAPSRLHFGLLDPVGRGERRFGGVGLMIREPGLQLAADPAAGWSFEGLLAERVARVVRGLLDQDPEAAELPLRIRVESAPPEHCGLGTGTQLALSLARAIDESLGREPAPPAALARRLERGRRSAIGWHGFHLGGFLVDGGKRADDALAPLVARLPFPEAWRIVLILPKRLPGLHGQDEAAAFARMPPDAAQHTGERCRLVLMNLLPALECGDFDSFSEGLYEFNRLAGESFRSVQGSAYAASDIGDRVAFARRQGARGAGQSSWGPAVFALAPDDQEANRLASRLALGLDLTLDEVLVVAADNQGARVWKD